MPKFKAGQVKIIEKHLQICARKRNWTGIKSLYDIIIVKSKETMEIFAIMHSSQDKIYSWVTESFELWQQNVYECMEQRGLQIYMTVIQVEQVKCLTIAER